MFIASTVCIIIYVYILYINSLAGQKQYRNSMFALGTNLRNTPKGFQGVYIYLYMCVMYKCVCYKLLREDALSGGPATHIKGTL